MLPLMCKYDSIVYGMYDEEICSAELERDPASDVMSILNRARHLYQIINNL